tara:strand:- start:1879 stop:2298 length:420 start_codon:yes stop_codon:yes gene_type:complete
MTNSKKKKICIVLSTYNEEITKQTCIITKKSLNKFGFNNLSIFYVPGAFEIPVSISRLINRFDAFIAIGCIIKGETNNFDLISKSITNAIMELSITHRKPIGNALITAYTKSQAKKRTQKGLEAALAVKEILNNEPKRT